jgi:ABC-type multidrug transport system ATPase subunit
MSKQGPLYVQPDERVRLSVRSLNVTLNHKKQKKKDDIENTSDKVILDELGFDLEAGKVLAILGSSGSGKTTLLNTLSSRLPNNDKSPFSFKGMVRYEPSQPNISYLLQEDSFLPGLTVFELLNYTGMLRLAEASKQERVELIDFLLESLGLEKVRDTVANSFGGTTTLSGGEQRRVSLALQLLTKPSLLFLDEPTTGLDATTSRNLIQTVKQLSIDFGITVILTIHQPRIEILGILDQICLLAKGGSMLLYGSLNKGFEYFESLDPEILGDGFINEESNFADFLLKISSVDKYNSAEIELETEQRVQRLITSWKSNQEQFLPETEYSDSFESHFPLFSQTNKHKISLFKESYILFIRSSVLTLRDFESFVMLFGILTLLSIICGWVFWKPDGSLAGIRTLTSTLYVCCEVIGYTPLMYEIQRLCYQDGKYMIREYKQDNLYSLKSWFIGRKLAKFLLEDIPISLIWSVITYYMWGLQSHSNFGIYFVNNLLIFMVGMATAHLCFVSGNFQFPLSSLLTGVFYQVQNSACGYFVNAKTMPVYVRWTKYIASFWYSFGSLMSNHFSSFMGDCEGTLEECFEYSGEYALRNLGFPKHWYAVPLIVNVGWFLGFYIASGLLIWYKLNKGGIKVVKERKPKHIKDVGSFVKMNDVSTNEIVPPLNFGLVLQHSTLALKRSFLQNTVMRKPFTEKTLLNNISLEFKPGLNAIMGPSGSGKTTLLNLITGRTNFSNLAIQGDIILENSVIPSKYLSKVTSYVVQDDSYLIPTLTVRETLVYQAKLRLDKSKHPYINNIVHKLMKRVGLLDVKNLPIGDYSTKGISGGEKRRLSIAIQLLNEDSKILLLDEPTSGLDSFTSQNIIDLLKEISEEFQKIIILTVHQPKFEIFQMFDQIVLLKAGELIYDGSSNDLIENINMSLTESEKQDVVSVQEDTNFADYLMDVLSEDKHKDELSRIISLNKTSKNEIMFADMNASKMQAYLQKRLGFFTTFPSILKRQFKVILRTEGVLLSRTGQMLVLGVVHALYFAPLKNTADSVSNRLGLIQEVLNLYFVGFFNNMSLYPIERNTFYNEYKDNLYSVFQFTLSYFVNEFPMEAMSSFVLSCFIVLIVGLPRTPEMFFSMWYACTLCVNCAESVGILFNTIFDHMGIAVNILSNLLIVGIFMGGTMSLNMPVLFRAFNYISPLKYAVLMLAQLGLEGQVFECLGGAQSCALSTGEEVLAQYNLESTLWVNYVALFAIFVIYRVVAYCAVRIKVSMR